MMIMKGAIFAVILMTKDSIIRLRLSPAADAAAGVAAATAEMVDRLWNIADVRREPGVLYDADLH